MKWITDFFKRRFGARKQEDDPGTEELRIAFKERYNHFKLLLSANNKALEIMTGIEQVLQGKQPFGMAFVRSNCIAITVNLLRLLKSLEHISAGKYNALYARFDEICHTIQTIIEQKREETDERFIIPLNTITRTMSDLVGNKMANLGEIQNRIHLKVPDGFAITAHAYRRFIEFNDLQTEIDRRYIATDITDMEALYSLSAGIRELILSSSLPGELEAAIRQATTILEKGMDRKITLALRSSAMGEDSAENSFAGQYHSELNVLPENVLTTYKEIIASKYSLTAVTYRLNKGIRDEDIAMSVGCIAMVDARSGGVMYSRNPIDIADTSVFINAAWGLPKAVVDGSIDGDLFVVNRMNPLQIVHKDIRRKDARFLCFAENSACRFEITGQSGEQPSIRDDEALTLAKLALSMEQYYGSAQDIEWAIDQKGTVFILQTRPLQQMDRVPPNYPDEVKWKSEENVLAGGGIAVCPGVASGEVFIVNHPGDMVHFPRGGILVARQALPVWASLLSRAAAVITEQGTFAGHLANVAREFKVPALFGLKDITTLLKNGDLVTLDTSCLCLYKGKIDLPAVETETVRGSIEGSPVYKILLEASKHIIPLTLLDPYAPEFKPENCLTFHDITRFSHEKAVQEMFDFGKSHNFSERSSKQLYYKVPMQWWVLNLDDGFTEEVKGKYIRLDNIACIPMLALWEGIVAVPWSGPPPIDGKGLVSVMFQSTANRALEPGLRSAYTERNYFMISKHFCSFTSRLGYHFSTVEALVSERTSENYINFRFKGGAADSQRRIRRVQFIGDILTDNSFRVETKEDNLVARIEGYEIGFMLERVKILGYLTMHTRQLDMIMSNSVAIQHYRTQIDHDIKTHLLSKPPLV
ncbi:MAG: PEP/pyruvate-binding domain-containing protein [Thermodesulfobacteriota bacterium]